MRTTMAAAQGGDNMDMPSYIIRHSIATKVAAKKTSKGYTLSEENCSLCEMPLMTLQGKSSCKICPAIKKWVDRKNEGCRQEQRGEDARDVVESSEVAEEVREEAPVEIIGKSEKSEVTDFKDLSKTDSAESDDSNAIRERARQIIKNAKCGVALDPIEDDESLVESPQAKWDGDMEWVEDRLIRDRAAQIIKQARKNIQAERGSEWCENFQFEPVTKSYDHYKMMSSNVKEVDPKMLSTKVVQAASKEVMGLDEIDDEACFKALRISNNHAHEDKVATGYAQKIENTGDAKAPQNGQEVIDSRVDGTAKKAPPTPSAYVSFIDFPVAKSLPTPTAYVSTITTKDFVEAYDVAKSPPTPAKPLSTPTAEVSTIATKNSVEVDDVAKSSSTPIAYVSSIVTQDDSKPDDDAKSPPTPIAATKYLTKADTLDAPSPSLDPTSTEIKSPAANAAVSLEGQGEIVHAIIAVGKGVPMNETDSTGIISGIASKVDDAIGIFKTLVSCNVEDLDVPFEDEVSGVRKQQLAHLQTLQRQQQLLVQQQMNSRNESLPMPIMTLNDGSYTDGCDDGFLVCGDRSAQASPGGLADCDYDVNPTELYLAIQRKDWESATNLAATFPKEASTWVSRMEINGKLRWRLLPLHAAIIFRAPNSAVSALLSAYSQGIACKDDQKMLPLHLALRHGCDEDVLHTLLMAYPHSIEVQDRKGRTPMVLAHKSTHAERDIYIRALEKGPAYYNRPLIKYDDPRYREKVTFEVEETYHIGLLAVNSGDGPARTVPSQYYEPQPTQTFLPQHFEPAAHHEIGFVATPQVYAANGFQYVPTMMQTPQGYVYPNEMRPPVMPVVKTQVDHAKENASGDANASEDLSDAMRRVNEAKAFIMSRNSNCRITPTSQANAAPFMTQTNVSTQGHPTESCFSRQGSLAPGAQANTLMPQLDTIAPPRDTIANTSGAQAGYVGPHRSAMTAASPQVLRSKGSLISPEDEDENDNHYADKVSLSPKMPGKHFFA